MLQHLLELLFDFLLERLLSFRPQSTQSKHQKVLGPFFFSFRLSFFWLDVLLLSFDEPQSVSNFTI